jgi:hypothetical protein
MSRFPLTFSCTSVYYFYRSSTRYAMVSVRNTEQVALTQGMVTFRPDKPRSPRTKFKK